MPKQWGYTGVATRQTEMSRAHHNQTNKKTHPPTKLACNLDALHHARAQRRDATWKLGLGWAQKSKNTQTTHHEEPRTVGRQGRPRGRASDSTRTEARQGFLRVLPKAPATPSNATSDVVGQEAHQRTHGHARATIQAMQWACGRAMLATKAKPVICPTLCTSILTPN